MISLRSICILVAWLCVHCYHSCVMQAESFTLYWFQNNCSYFWKIKLLWSHIRGSYLAVVIFFLSEQGQLLNSSIGSLWSKFFILKVDIVLKGVIPQISKKEIIKVVPLCLNGGKTRYQIPNLEWRDFFQYYHTNPIFSVLQLLKHWDIFFLNRKIFICSMW